MISNDNKKIRGSHEGRRKGRAERVGPGRAERVGAERVGPCICAKPRTAIRKKGSFLNREFPTGKQPIGKPGVDR